MRVLVCGGRDYNDRDTMHKVLVDLWRTAEITDGDRVAHRIVLMCGMATGADILAHQWAKYHAVQCLQFTADWDQHGRAAGPIRNQQMLDEGKPDLVVAFPGGRGTADMIRRAKKAGLPVREIPV